MQGDGNLVLYRNSDGKPLWATGTTGGSRAIMQGDGNLVVYTSSGVPVWASNTVGNDGAIVQLQNDGNLVIYKGPNPIWASGTVQITVDPRKHPWAVILCRFKGSPPDPALEAPIEQFYREAFTPGSGGLVEYWRDASLGSIDISDSRVFPPVLGEWVEVDIPRSAAGGTPPNGPGRSGLVDYAIKAAKDKGFDPVNGFYSQIAIYTQNWSNDDPGRLAVEDKTGRRIPNWQPDDPLKPWWPTWIDGSADGRSPAKVTLTPPHNGNITAHEMGHGLGMQHDMAPDLIREYADPCCIMSQNGPFKNPKWGRPFGPAVCLQHLVQRGWMFKDRVYYDDGGWMAQPDGITLPLAPLSRPIARANLGIKLAYKQGASNWDYYLEYVIPTEWDQGVPGAPYVFIRRLATISDGEERPVYLGNIQIGKTTEFVEPSGNVRFRAELTDLPGPIMVTAQKL
jgi:hypothetical protein